MRNRCRGATDTGGKERARRVGGQPETLLRRSLKQTPATEAEAPGEHQRSCRLQVRRWEPAS